MDKDGARRCGLLYDGIIFIYSRYNQANRGLSKHGLRLESVTEEYAMKGGIMFNLLQKETCKLVIKIRLSSPRWNDDYLKASRLAVFTITRFIVIGHCDSVTCVTFLSSFFIIYHRAMDMCAIAMWTYYIFQNK